jgi:uncharacterized membrane protein YhiD involved in acid resistance
MYSQVVPGFTPASMIWVSAGSGRVVGTPHSCWLATARTR